MNKMMIAGALALGSVFMAGTANALPASGLATVPLAGDVQQAQFFFGGRNYCWYDDGWHGPGFYWCGYAFRRGLGWGGGYGWHGWHGGRGHGGRGHGGWHGGHRGGGHVGIRTGGGAHRSAVRAGGGGGHRGGGGGGHRGGGGGHSGGKGGHHH